MYAGFQSCVKYPLYVACQAAAAAAAAEPHHNKSSARAENTTTQAAEPSVTTFRLRFVLSIVLLAPQGIAATI
jgi:hypothetical protein